MSFFSQIEGPVLRILNELMNDPKLAEELTYRLYQGQAFDEAEKYNVDSFEELTVTGVRLRHDLKSAAVATGGMQAGDLFFLFRFDDLPGTISVKDSLVDASGVEFKVRGINKVFGLALSISVDGQ